MTKVGELEENITEETLLSEIISEASRSLTEFAGGDDFLSGLETAFGDNDSAPIDIEVPLPSSLAPGESTSIDSGSGFKLNFANAEIPTDTGIIRGLKWDDLNGNGARDTELVQGANPDIVYVLDVSGSADDPFEGTAIGDLNNDGLENTRLDAEIAGFTAINEQLIAQGLGNQAEIAIVVFSGNTANADMNLATDGLQLTTFAGTDTNDDGITDVEEVLRSIVSGALGVGNNTGTNPEAALQAVEETFTNIGTETGNGNVIFLTDGESNRGGSVTDEVERLNAQEFNLSAFGVGEGSDLAEIQEIDPDGIQFTSTDQLLDVLSDLSGGGEGSLEPGLSGVRIYLDANNNGVFDANEPVQITAEDDPATPDIDETGQYEFTNLPPSTYTVREIVPEGFEQTFPVGEATPTGDGFADTILDYFNSGEGPFDEPYGGDNQGDSPVPVPTDIILGSDTNGWLSLPTGSFVTVGFTDEIIVDSPGDDIFISEVVAAGEQAEVFVSSNLEDFTLLGIGNGGDTSRFDLASIGFTEPVRAIKVVGLDNGGGSPGFDVVNVQGLPGSVASSDFYTVELGEGEVVENLNFANAEIPTDTGVNDAPTATADNFTTDEDTAFTTGNVLDNDNDVDGDTLTVSAVNGNGASVGTEIALDSGALLTLEANGNFDYDPNRQFESLTEGETATDSFTYTVSDGNGGTDTATVTVTIEGVADNDDPVEEFPSNINDATNSIFILQETSPDTVPVSPSFFIDFAGTQDATRTIDIAAGGGAQNLDAGVTVNLDGDSSDFFYQRDGSTLEIIDSDGNVTAQILASPNATSTVNFNDGSTEVAVDGSEITFGGESLENGEQISGANTALELESTSTTEALDGLGTLGSDPASLDAGSGSFNFLDTVSEGNNVAISNFGENDQITLEGVSLEEVSFAEFEGNTRLELDNGAGTVSRITLLEITTGATSVSGFNAEPNLGDVVFA